MRESVPRDVALMDGGLKGCDLVGAGAVDSEFCRAVEVERDQPGVGEVDITFRATTGTQGSGGGDGSREIIFEIAA